MCPVQVQHWQSRVGLKANNKSRFATAYAITKVLMPFRIVFSVFATPWFAKISVIPFMNAIRRALRSRRMKPPTSGAAGTGAVGGGVGPGQK